MAALASITIDPGHATGGTCAQLRVAMARHLYDRATRQLALASTPREARRAANMRHAAASVLPSFNLRLIAGGVA